MKKRGLFFGALLIGSITQTQRETSFLFVCLFPFK